jgi:hypothetical protein
VDAVLTNGGEEGDMRASGDSISRSRLWRNRVLAGAVFLLLVFDAAVQLAVIPVVVDALSQMRMPVALSYELRTTD